MKPEILVNSIYRRMGKIKIFNPADATRKGVAIVNFNSLDAHPDMIPFFGSFNKNTGSIQTEKLDVFLFPKAFSDSF